jgi:hypothetical protein
MLSLDNSAHVCVTGHIAEKLPESSIFSSAAEVSQFFEAGSLGYSPRKSNGEFDGLELRAFNWHVTPLRVTQVRSSFFQDRNVFPPDSVTFDNALLMRGIHHEWHSRVPIAAFRTEYHGAFAVRTMNGNKAKAFQSIAREVV